MKKLISLIMALITIVMCITSCSTPNDKNDNNEKISIDKSNNNEEIPKDENKPIEYIFLYSPGQAVPGDENAPSNSTGFVHINDYGVNHGTKSEDKVFDELKGKKKTPFEGSGTLVYDHSDCRFKTNKIKELELTNLSMTSHNIVTSTSGEAFLRIIIEYDTDEGFRTGDSVFINIQ